MPSSAGGGWPRAGPPPGPARARAATRAASPTRRCPMAELNGGRLLARCLANEGVRFVFGLPSPEIDPLLAALDEPGMRLVPIPHEAAGAHLAGGLYKPPGQVAALTGNPRPGPANPPAGGV